MVFNFFEHWRKARHHAGTSEKAMPLTEKDSEEAVQYPYNLKKVRVRQDIEIAYIDEGPEDAAVLLFIHGLVGGIPSWYPAIPVLSKQYRCIALDLPGHGYSTKGDFAYNMAFFTEACLSFINKLGLSKVSLVGHSMGGQIAILLALKVPALIDRMVLVSPAGIEPYTPLEKQLIISSTVALAASGNAFTQYRQNYLMAFNHNPEEAGELLAKLAFYKKDATTMSRLLVRAVEGMLLESVNGVLHRIQQPCLVLVGNEDQVSPYQYFHRQRFAEITKTEVAKIPDATLIVLSPCGHYVQYQQPKTFNNAVIEFISNNPKKD